MSTEPDLNELEALLSAGAEAPSRLDACLALIGRRRKASRNKNEALDRLLLERHAKLSVRNATLESELQKLQANLD